MHTCFLALLGGRLVDSIAFWDLGFAMGSYLCLSFHAGDVPSCIPFAAPEYTSAAEPLRAFHMADSSITCIYGAGHSENYGHPQCPC